jgi:leucyl/phenylalanyl-tRNA--protein transferase
MFGEMADDWTAWPEEFGLVGVGGDLSPERLLDAYRRGVFPWYDETMPICWWSPDPRAIFELETFRPSRRLLRTYRGRKFQLTLNRDFAGVIRGCADRPDEGTWITPAMIDAYQALHELGHAHSVETWQDGELVGGVYGVAIGAFFAGESMFHRRSDAANVALLHLMNRLRERGFILFDTQFLTEHTARLGAIEIPRQDYLERLSRALRRQTASLDSSGSRA